MTPIPEPGKGSGLVQNLCVGIRTYELRFVDCGRSNCTRCTQVEGRRPSHGPYWYLCVTRGKRWRRVYIGKDLHTDKFISPDGSIDWGAINNRGGKRQPLEQPSKNPPGQLDILDDKSDCLPYRTCRTCGKTQVGDDIIPTEWSAYNLCAACALLDHAALPPPKGEPKS